MGKDYTIAKYFEMFDRDKRACLLLPWTFLNGYNKKIVQQLSVFAEKTGA